MTIIRTNFRPEIDGYAFDNDWTLSSTESAQIHAVVAEVFPKVIEKLMPVLMAASPAVLAILGPGLLLAGPFLPLILKIAVKDAVKAIGDEIASDATTWCGGLAFSAMDFYQLNWAIPRGTGPDDQPQPAGAPNATPGSAVLRAYIWARLIDCQLANLETGVVWHFMLKYMGSFGRDYVRDKTRDALVAIGASITAGNPCVIYLTSPGDDPSVDHVVIAIGYELLTANVWRLELYDDDEPNSRPLIQINAENSPVSIYEVGSGGEQVWTGLFVTDYTPKQPKPAIFMQSPLTLTPPGFCGVNQIVTASFAAFTQGFHQTLRLQLGVGPPNVQWTYFNDYGRPVYSEGSIIPMNYPAETKFSSPGLLFLVPRVSLWADSQFDPNGNLPPSVKTVPNPDGTPVAPLPYRVTPAIPIKGRGKIIDPCDPVYVAGQEMWLDADVHEVLSVGIVGYTWALSGALTIFSHDASPHISALPAAGSQIHVKLTVGLADGTSAYGSLDFSVLGVEIADEMSQLCRFLHKLEDRFWPMPLVPGDEAIDLERWLQSPQALQAADVRQFANNLSSLANEMQASLRSDERA